MPTQESYPKHADGQQPQSRWFRHRQSYSLKGEKERVVKAGNKGAFQPTRREFIDVAAVEIRLKQVARAVKGQAFRITHPGGKGASRSTRREFINVAAGPIRLKQIACA